MDICFGKLFCVNYKFLIAILIGIISILVIDKMTKRRIKFMKHHPGKKFSILKNRHLGFGRMGRMFNMFNPNYYRRLNDPLAEPVKNYTPTRVDTKQQYQQVGYAYRSESNSDYNPDEKNRFSLYGRRNYRDTNKFEYYIIAGGIKIVLSQTSELYSGDTISITGYSGTFTVDIYENQQYDYNPNLF